MTENTIDLASIAPTLSGPSNTESRGAIGVCRTEHLFGESFDHAMQVTNITNDDAYQDLPSARQDLPPDGTFGLGLEGLEELRTLAEAIAGNATSVAEKNSEFSKSGEIFGGAPGLLNGALDLSADAETYFKGDPKPQIQQLRAFLAITNPEMKTAATDAFSPPENSEGLVNRHSSIENQSGIPPVAQVNTKPLIHANESQASQHQTANRSRDVVSSTELATHVRVLRSSGGGEARLQLHPAELGRMTVSLTTEGNEARVTFIVDNTQAKQAVEASLSRLRDLLDGAGLNLADAEVSERDSENRNSQSDDQSSQDSVTNSSEVEEDFDKSAAATSTQLIDAFA